MHSGTPIAQALVDNELHLTAEYATPLLVEYAKAVPNAFRGDSRNAIAVRTRRDEARERTQLSYPIPTGCTVDGRIFWRALLKNLHGTRVSTLSLLDELLGLRVATLPKDVAFEPTDDTQLKALLWRAELMDECLAAGAAVRSAIDQGDDSTIKDRIANAFKIVTSAMLSDLEGIPEFVDVFSSVQEYAAQYADDKTNEEVVIALAIGFALSEERAPAKRLLQGMSLRLASSVSSGDVQRLRALALMALAGISFKKAERDKQMIAARNAWRAYPKNDRAFCRMLLRRYRAILRRQGKPAERIEAVAVMEELYSDESCLDSFSIWVEAILDKWEKTK